MTTKKRAFVFVLLVMALLLSGCQQPTDNVQNQPGTSNASEAQDDIATPTTPAPIPEEQATDHPLKSVVETVLAKLPKKAPGSFYDIYNRAVLLDFNEDGVEELLLTYCGVNHWEQRLEIWTVRDEKAVLLWEETLFEHAGGPSGGVRMVQKGEAPYLCVYSTNAGARGIDDNCQFMGSLDFYSPTYQTEDGLYRQYWLSYDFFGPDNRTPAPDELEPEAHLVFDGQRCDTDVFQAWIEAFDQSTPSLLHVGGVLDEPIGMKLSEILTILS